MVGGSTAEESAALEQFVRYSASPKKIDEERPVVILGGTDAVSGRTLLAELEALHRRFCHSK